MRTTLGLEQPERSIGLSAHDFAMLAAGPDVLLTRSLKAGAEGAARHLGRQLTTRSATTPRAAHALGTRSEPIAVPIPKAIRGRWGIARRLCGHTASHSRTEGRDV